VLPEDAVDRTRLGSDDKGCQRFWWAPARQLRRSGDGCNEWSIRSFLSGPARGIPGHEGRHAPEASQVHADRVGALVHANADGLTGSMHFAWRSVDPSSSEHAVEIEVIATSFDLRDAPEPVASIWSPITEHEHRAAMAKIARMSPAEEATSPERAIAFANRFGAIPSPYFENILEHVRQRDPLRHQGCSTL
jgi:hypothetical protein